MAANRQLEAFLAEEARGSAPATEPQTPTPATPEAPQAAPEPKAAPTPPAESKAAGTGPSGPEPAEDDGEPSDRLDHDGHTYIPRQAFDRERQRRQDWKEKAARLEGQLAEMTRQQEAAQRAASQPPPQPVYRQPAPDPAADPHGYANYVRQQQMEAQLNHQLNVSEMLLREKIGDAKVSEYVNEFKELAQRDQTLYGKLYSQPHPYSWMQREVERQRVLRDVGDDPSAYRSKIEAEARAKWEAEATARQPPAPVSPAAGLQPSLATARSVAGRTAPNWSGMTSEEDLVASIQNRKRSNGGAPRF
jgi:hypothetical protein